MRSAENNAHLPQDVMRFSRWIKIALASRTYALWHTYGQYLHDSHNVFTVLS